MNSKLKLTLVNLKLLTVKHSVNQLKSEGKFVRQSGGRGQYGHCWVEFEPLMKQVLALSLKIKLLVVLFLRNIFLQLKLVLKKHWKMVLLAGYPMVDVKATLYDGSYHDVDSSEMAFKIAGSMALKQELLKLTLLFLNQ